ncbi:MAG: 3-methyl-2-oxobutanoate dehydrogenase subunit beta [Candidatus Latescibacteria bacterium]|nr:3-methyl-2-oxobutanoate dehydrogenase subunit beta [Candidatus Latescibacterota bacterium]NIM21149.1 3-methyl-2-oxobutanoate dehydrogenase subunit beta [Candidatus Latescibacterota bacterium]NIM65284.1 3-methyl-2-oxobutanoate dehydrogenase subunit beta [Candidatus Latescibacterota bacterium]NIO01799.1 3-methyl-2-oxobutanoate dehydrogenase subunit beta [Candidatus Latescibacterota bacterium]NIO28316.1 3-methyl-2-oxobutanoate dehydrogenase subunit beta [Candidatus Latescibacterota bacterium]
MGKYPIAEDELMTPGHLACQGCGATQAMRYALKALGQKTIVVMPACCWSVIDGPFPHTSLKVPIFHTAFETAGSVASGVKAGLEMRGDSETTVLAWAGDGGTFDIGLQALSGAAERNEDIVYCCYDNEAYMNTGIQRSSATPPGAWTTTTPRGDRKRRPKKKIIEILAAHGIPYIATASVAYPNDLIAKFQKAKGIRGTKFIHVFAPCPTGWKSAPELTVKLARLAVESRLFPLLEVENGHYKLNKDIPQKPVREYLSLQGRFSDMTEEEIQRLERDIDEFWQSLLIKENSGGLLPGITS